MNITAKGLANFMTAGESRKRKILKDFKEPDPEGFAQANYYHEARDAIRRFLKGESDLPTLRERAASLRVQADAASGATAARLCNNARAIAQFARGFHAFDCEVLRDLGVNLYVSYAGVRVSASPDLRLRLRGRETLVRFEFSKQPQPAAVPRVMCQLMADACTACGVTIAASDCLYIDVPRGEIYRRARARARASTDIEAACRNIAAIWPTV